jgi:hypothetical protein
VADQALDIAALKAVVQKSGNAHRPSTGGRLVGRAP